MAALYREIGTSQSENTPKTRLLLDFMRIIN
jgi:hypothetical protein